MCIVGKRQGGRVGYLILNSWGSNWVSGPKYLDQPDGSFYAEPAVVARILRAGDSYALSGQTGFERKILPFWMLRAVAEIPPLAESVDDQDQELRNQRVFQKNGRTYFREDDGRLLEFKDGQWWDCTGGSCRKVSAYRREEDWYALAA